MKYISFTFLMVLLCQSAFSQSKKEQIETLIFQKDSLGRVLTKERQLNTDQVKQLESKISKINSDMALIQKELAKSRKDLAEKEEETSALNAKLEALTVQLNAEKVPAVDTTASGDVFNENPITSLAEEEAESKMREFLLESSKKYKDYGEARNIILYGGNYTKDEVQDYFYSVDFETGSDFWLPIHFFYDSEQDKIIELTLNYDSKIPISIFKIDQINEGKIVGQVLLWNAFSDEHISERILNVEFTINGAMIIIDKKYYLQLKGAENDIIYEIKKMKEDLYKN